MKITSQDISSDLTLFSWINFDHENLKHVSLSEKQLVAVVDDHDTIIIWKQHDNFLPPSGRNGSLVTVIIDQFQNIERIAWVYGEESLVIKEPDKMTLWDPYNNVPLFTIPNTDNLYFVKKIEDKYIMCTPSGKLILFNQHMVEIQPSSGELIWQTQSSIVVYPFEYLFDEGQFIRQELEDNRIDRRLRRHIRGANSKSYEFVFGVEERAITASAIKIPDQFLYRFEEGSVIFIAALHNGILVKNVTSTLFIDDSTNSYVLSPVSQCIITENEKNPAYVKLLTPENEYRIVQKSGRIVIESLTDIMKNEEFRLQNLPYSFLIPYKPELSYTHIDLKMGLMWIPDFYSSHILYDLLTNEQYLIDNTIHNKFVQVFVDSDIDYVLEWEKGMGYPEGKLRYHQLDEDKHEILYDFDKTSLTIESQIFNKEENTAQTQLLMKNPLIIPAWNRISLFVYYGEKRFESIVSLSAFYMMLSKWISLQNIDQATFSEKNPRGYAFVKYGDLSISFEGKSYHFEGISPIWDYRPDLGLIAFASYDENLYLWDLEQYLPIHSFRIGLPYTIEISPSGRYLLTINFGMTELQIQDDESELSTSSDYPKLSITIFDTTKKKKFSRSYKFPTHLKSPKIISQLEEEDTFLQVNFPSYIHKGSSTSVIFDTVSSKFETKYENSKITFKDTHSHHGSLSQIKEGLEFPVEPHPEIKREYQYHTAEIHDFTMYRKNDSLVIASVLKNTETVPQVSTELIFLHKEKISLDMPFYAGKMKPIYIDSEFQNLIRDAKLLKLDRDLSLPSHQIQSLAFKNKNKAYLKRLAIYLKDIITSNQVHSDNGIAYFSEDVKNFQSKLNALYTAIEAKIGKN